MLTNILTVAALAAIAISSPATAAPADAAGREVVEGIVRHGDLDLTRAADVAALEQRVKRKARSLCVTGFERDQITADTLRCRAEVIASARRQIDLAVELAALGQTKRRG